MSASRIETELQSLLGENVAVAHPSSRIENLIMQVTNRHEEELGDIGEILDQINGEDDTP